MYSAVLILPANLKELGNQVGEAMGWGPESYTIPLTNSEEVTHYGLRADVSDQFIDWVINRNNLPDIPDLSIVLDNLIYDFSGTEHNLWGREHFDYVCENYELCHLN